MRCNVTKDFIFLDLYNVNLNINYEIKLMTSSKRCESIDDVRTLLKMDINKEYTLSQWFCILDNINALMYRG